MAAGKVVVTVTPELDPYYPAQEVRVTIEVFNADDVQVDPGALTLTVRKPDDTEYLIDILSMVHVGTGHYYYDVLLDTSYSWRLRVESGGPDAAEELDIVVSGSVFTTAVPAPVGPGTGHEGEIARVTGGVYVPYAGSADEQPLVWRTGVGWVGQALNLAAAAAVSGLLALTHIPPGTTGQVLTTDGGGNVTWAAGGGGSGVPGGSTTELQYNNAGAFDGAAGIHVNGSENQLQFSDYGVAAITQRNQANTNYVPLIGLGLSGTDKILIGHSAQVAGLITSIAVGGTYELRIDNIAEYTLSSTALSMLGNNIDMGAGLISFGASPAGPSGLLRTEHNVTLWVGKTNAGATASLIQWGVGVVDMLEIGHATSVAAIYYRSNTEHRWHVNSAQVASLGATALALAATNLTQTTGFVQQGTNPASAGFWRLPGSGANVYAAARNNANSANINLLAKDGSDNVFVGDSAAGGDLVLDAASTRTLRLRVAGTPEYIFSATELTLGGNNVVGAGFYSLTGTVSGTGAIRLANTNSLKWRNAANSADVQALSVESDNRVELGDGTNASSVRILAAGAIGLRPSGSGSDEYSFTSAALDMLGNNLLMGAGFINSLGTAATGGFINTPHAIAFWSARNQAGSGDVIMLNWGGSGNNVLDIGGSGTSVATLNYWVASGGVHTFKINNADELSLSSTALDLINNDIVRANVSDASATTFLIRGTGSTASNNSGGKARFAGGRRAGTGNYGGVGLYLNQDDSSFHTMVEALHLINAQRIVSLARGSDLTTTEMPTNTGDKVVYVGNAATNPSADGVNGHVYYSDSARPAWRFNATNLRLDGTSTTASAGGVTNVPATVTTFLTVTLNGTVGKIPVFAT